MDFRSKLDIQIRNQEVKRLCYEDAHCLVFDVQLKRNDQIHFIITPKKIAKLSSASCEDEKLFGHLLLTAKNIAFNKGLLITGYNIVVDEDYGTSRLKCLHLFGGSYIRDRTMKNKSRL